MEITDETIVSFTNCLEHLTNAVNCINESIGALIKISSQLRTDVDKLIENTQGGCVK